MNQNQMMMKVAARLVREGRAEYVMIDGKPGLRLVKPTVQAPADTASADQQSVEAGK